MMLLAPGTMAGSGSMEKAGHATTSGGTGDRGMHKTISALGGTGAPHPSLRATEIRQLALNTAKTAGIPLTMVRCGPAAPAGSRSAKHAGQNIRTRGAISAASLLLLSKALAASVESTPAKLASIEATPVPALPPKQPTCMRTDRILNDHAPKRSHRCGSGPNCYLRNFASDHQLLLHLVLPKAPRAAAATFIPLRPVEQIKRGSGVNTADPRTGQTLTVGISHVMDGATAAGSTPTGSGTACLVPSGSHTPALLWTLLPTSFSVHLGTPHFPRAR